MKRLSFLGLLALSSMAQAAPQRMDQAAAKGLVERWLAAQNTQDFAAYQALYAKKFDGIKRAGARTRTFNRKSWLADRQRMFAKPMTVSADQITVQATLAMARVRFNQSFTLGRFHDEGPKELLLVLEAGRPVIAREEMLSSALGQQPPRDDGILFVVPGGVLLPLGADTSWSREPPRLLPGKPGDYAATRAVDLATAPAPARAWQGRTVHFPGGCTATIKTLALLVRAVPPDIVTEYWSGRTDESGDPIEHGKRAPAAEIARSLWGMAPVELIGVLDQACPDARWATTATGTPAAATLTTLKPGQPGGRAALALVKRHAAYRKLQAEYDDQQAEQGERTGPWDDTLAIRQIEGAGQSLIVVTVSRFGGCGGFDGGLTFVFARAAGDKLTLLNEPAAEPAWNVDAAADLDGDGSLELLGNEVGAFGETRTIVRQRAGRYGVTGRSILAFLGCGC
jgi:hypothetical protein